MEKQVLIVCLVVGFLGLFSVILGFTAEFTKIKASDVVVLETACYYPSSPAFGCAAAAVLLLVVAKIIMTAFNGCCRRCRRDPSLPAVTGTKRTVGIILIIISWSTFGVSVFLFILGAGKNGPGNQTNYDACYVVKPGIFAIASVFSLITLVLSITPYILFNPDNGVKQDNYGNNGIGLGQPHFVPA